VPELYHGPRAEAPDDDAQFEAYIKTHFPGSVGSPGSSSEDGTVGAG
jgi:hypothetical protein